MLSSVKCVDLKHCDNMITIAKDHALLSKPTLFPTNAFIKYIISIKISGSSTLLAAALHVGCPMYDKLHPVPKATKFSIQVRNAARVVARAIPSPEGFICNRSHKQVRVRALT